MRTVTQKGFCGVDERVRFSDSLDYASEMKNLRITSERALKKKTGRQLVCTVDGAESVESLWCGSFKGRSCIVFSAGGKLYSLDIEDDSSVPVVIGEIGTGKCCMFEYNEYLYIMKPDYYGKYDGELLVPVIGYVPCVAMNCSPKGGGEIYEQVNLLSTKRRQLFSAEATAVSYKLAENNISNLISVSVDGVPYEFGYVLMPELGRLDIEKPIPEGINNLEVIYEITSSTGDEMIYNCTNAMVFGGNTDKRVFLWGNEKYPNYRFHSDLADGVESAEYFPIDGFTVIGNNNINCIAQQYNKQLIFTENEAFYSYCELKNDSLGNTFASFPVFNLNSTKGCVVKSDGCIINNNPVTLCADGLNLWESSAIENEKNARCISDSIGISLRNALENEKNIRFFDFQADNELYFVCGDTAYIYNYANKNWFVYDDFYGDNYTVFGAKLYFSSGNSIYVTESVTENGDDEECVWVSPFVTLGQNGGATDIVGFEADLEAVGDTQVRFELESSGGERISVREFCFTEENGGFKRIEFRPSLKRAMPFRIKYTARGTGRCTLYNITIKAREKERSKRYGIQ